jgi:hypothetical protein
MNPFVRLKWNYRNRRDHRRARKLLEKDPGLFDEVRTYCFFLGYPRSGHSLVGSLLDAHPHTAIAHEQDALKYIDKGYERRELFAILLQNAERIGRKGRQQTGYSYQVPGQYQGEWSKLQVIGDKRGGNSSRWLRDKPELLGKLRETLSEEMRVIHISRNPFDNIATMAYRHAKGRPERMTEAVLRQEKEHYLSLARSVERSRKELEEDEFFHLSNEELLADPSTHLPRMLSFLGLEPFEDHLEACKSILYDSPSRSRERFHWPKDLVEEIEASLEELPLLAGYRFREREA